MSQDPLASRLRTRLSRCHTAVFVRELAIPLAMLGHDGNGIFTCELRFGLKALAA